ncbi:hypothetical protein [uncultured Nostoc sp.]
MGVAEWKCESSDRLKLADRPVPAAPLNRTLDNILPKKFKFSVFIRF